MAQVTTDDFPSGMPRSPLRNREKENRKIKTKAADRSSTLGAGARRRSRKIQTMEPLSGRHMWSPLGLLNCGRRRTHGHWARASATPPCRTTRAGSALSRHGRPHPSQLRTTKTSCPPRAHLVTVSRRGCRPLGASGHRHCKPPRLTKPTKLLAGSDAGLAHPTWVAGASPKARAPAAKQPCSHAAQDPPEAADLRHQAPASRGLSALVGKVTGPDSRPMA